MEGVESKAQLPQEDSQISIDFPISLAENIEGFQQNVDEVFEAIEQDESFSEMTAENYNQKKSYLIKQFTRLSCMHKLLADQHDHLIGKVKKQNLDSCNSSSPQVTEKLRFQQNVNEVLEEIEQDESFSEMTAENYDLKKSYLIKHVTELSCMHRVLADQHIHLIREVKKQNLDFSDSCSPQVTQMLIPGLRRKTIIQRNPIGFDFVLSPCWKGFEISKTEDSESFFPSTSDVNLGSWLLKMEGVESKSQLPRVDSLISLDLSIPLAENIEGFQQHVNEVIEAIEHDGSFSETTAENYDQKKSYLKKHLTELLCMHKVLADQHIHLIGKVRQQNLGSSGSSSPQVTENLWFEQNVYEVLEAIKQDESFSNMTSENYDLKKSYFIKHLNELSCMHRVLAYQHVNLITEVKKHNFDSSDSSSSHVTQMETPGLRSKTIIQRTPLGFYFVLGHGWRGFSISKTKDSECSLPLSSDSDLETFLSTIKRSIPNVDDDLLKVIETKISEFLSKKNPYMELVSYKQKLLEYENTKLMQELQENESDIKTQKADLEAEKAKVIELQKQVADLKLAISESNLKIKAMGDELETSKKKLSVASGVIFNLNDERYKNSKENQRLKDIIASEQQFVAQMRKQVDSHGEKILGFQEEVSLRADQVLERDNQIKELKTTNSIYVSKISQLERALKSKEETWRVDVGRLKAEVKAKCKLFDDLKKRYNTSISEKDILNAQLKTLQAKKCSQDNLIQELESRLNSLQVEHGELLSSYHDAKEVKNELTLRVGKLEREVASQKEVISDRTQEKREAIRQLSSSLEHYMSRYKELHQAFIAKRASCFYFLS